MNGVPIEDDGRRWLIREGQKPFVVLPCNVCKVPVVISHGSGYFMVNCPVCRKSTPPVCGGDIFEALKRWNKMVDGEN